MSTFDGYLKEFPAIAIDYFRPRSSGRPPPLAYLLSHIHSDHLQGLESKDFGAGFIYTSTITKSLLLNIQTPQSRRNTKFQAGESCQYTYGHLRAGRCGSRELVRSLPMNRPNRLMIGQDQVTVTLLDANHCPGAVMFLIESDSKRVLYTGDIRAEDYFVHGLRCNPFVNRYLAMRQALDCLYLDTSARLNGPTYGQNVQGCVDLVTSIEQYPRNMVFTFPARCLGYEKVLLSLALSFQSKVHVDDYTFDLYRLIAESSPDSEDAAVYDCITRDGNTRFHSCGSWEACSHVLNARKDDREVYIKAVNAIVPRDEISQEESEASAFLGETDFDGQLQLVDFSPSLAASSRDVSARIFGEKEDLMSQQSPLASPTGHDLPRKLVFCFARHSSWQEQHRLVSLFHPLDVQSCTGETSFEYLSSCRDLPKIVNDRSPDITHNRRHALKIMEYQLAGAQDWSASPRMRRKRLCTDIEL